MTAAPPHIHSAVKDIFNAWGKAMQYNDVDAVSCLWAEDGVYMLPGLPVMRGIPQIRATIGEVWKTLHAQAAGGDVISGFELTTLVDGAAGDEPQLVTAYGGQSVTIGSAPTQHVQGTAVVTREDGQWKLRLIAVVNAPDELLDVIQKSRTH